MWVGTHTILLKFYSIIKDSSFIQFQICWAMYYSKLRGKKFTKLSYKDATGISSTIWLYDDSSHKFDTSSQKEVTYDRPDKLQTLYLMNWDKCKMQKCSVSRNCQPKHKQARELQRYLFISMGHRIQIHKNECGQKLKCKPLQFYFTWAVESKELVAYRIN